MNKKLTKKELKLIRTFQKYLKGIEESHNQHMNHLSQFMIHDIKNNIQNMDSILSIISDKEISPQEINDLKEQVKSIRRTIDNFKNLIPSEESKFSILTLINTVESLNRSILNGIDFEKEMLEEAGLTSSFHSWIQILHNLIINAIEHLKLENITSPKIKVLVAIENNSLLNIRVYDNGKLIPSNIRNKIFDLGYSTKEQSTGIGLFHVKYLCELFNWDIKLKNSDIDNYTKYFEISVPVKPIGAL